MKRIAILTSSFSVDDKTPINTLAAKGYELILNPHARKLSFDEVPKLVAECVGIIAGLEEYRSETFHQLKNLKVISRVGVGLDNIDLQAAARAKVKVFSTPDAVTVSVAELTVGLMLDLLRHISFVNADMKQKRWARETGNLIHKKNIGIIGFGRIGKKVASLLSAFDCSIYYYDPNVASSPSFKVQACASLDELLKRSDIVSIHCQPLGNNKPLLGVHEFKSMKEGSWLINTSRGSLIDEHALFDALKAKKISGAALDVFNEEPYQGPLSDLDNVILTPHIGSYAQESRNAMELEAVQNLLKGLEA